MTIWWLVKIGESPNTTTWSKYSIQTFHPWSYSPRHDSITDHVACVICRVCTTFFCWVCVFVHFFKVLLLLDCGILNWLLYSILFKALYCNLTVLHLYGNQRAEGKCIYGLQTEQDMRNYTKARFVLPFFPNIVVRSVLTSKSSINTEKNNHLIVEYYIDRLPVI